MAEGTARALGASDGTVKIGETECTIRPLGARSLAEVERECLKQYKRRYLQTFKENADLLPDGVDFPSIMSAKLDECAKWDLEDLPQRFVSDWRRVKVTDKLREIIASIYEKLEEADEDRVKKMVSSALDRGLISAGLYKDATGQEAPLIGVGYVHWWISGSIEGMITMVWMSFKDDGVSKAQVADALTDDPALLATISRRIEELSAPEPDFT